jgi:hypothetical protein
MSRPVDTTARDAIARRFTRRARPSRGIVHRDIKPDNGGLGLSETSAQALAAGLLFAAEELPLGNRWTHVDLGGGRSAIVIFRVLP